MTQVKLNESFEIDLTTLIDTRLLIQANSGGGKSWCIRRLLEQTHGKVQQIVIDLEGEFSTLREKYDYVLVSKDGDIKINTKIPELLARKLLELNVSAIIDLYELKHHERISFVKRFLDSMINAPKALWHPVLVIVDEAHVFAPEKGQSESLGSVIDLQTRGRKRGQCGVLATQRLSKLHKDAAAECNNKLIGRTGLDIDMKRAGDELGFTSKSQILSLRDLDPGEFYAFGPAISKSIEQIKIGDIETTHPKAGMRQLVTPPPATQHVKNLLSKLDDLPQKAEEELNTMNDLKRKIRELKFELRKKPSAEIDPKSLDRARDQGYREGLRVDKLNNVHVAVQLKECHKAIDRISSIASSVSDVEIPKSQTNFPIPRKNQMPIETVSRPIKENPAPNYESRISNDNVTGGAMRMLKAVAMYHPKPITRQRMASLSGLSHKSGTFGTYLATLKSNNYITGYGNEFTITEEGLDCVGDVPDLPEDPESLVNMWCNIVKGGASRMLKSLSEIYPDYLSREDLGNRAGISYTSGTFGTYLATLKRNGLIEVQGQMIKASKDLMEG